MLNEITDRELTRLHATDTLSHKLLSKTQERALLIEKCELQTIDQPTEAETRRLNEIINNLITNNMRLVSKVATFYSRNTQLEWRDLAQEGVLGLHTAIVKFDASKTGPDGTPLKLSTYATHWIRQRIERYTHDNGRTIRLPVHFSSNIMPKIKVAAETFQKQHGRLPTIDELKAASGCNDNQVALALQWFFDTRSLNAPIENDRGGEIEFGDLLTDEASLDPVTTADANERKEMLAAVMDKALTPREAKILTMRFGLDGNPPKTLEIVGNNFGITRERIRQIETVALRKLRHPRITRYIKHLL